MSANCKVLCFRLLQKTKTGLLIPEKAQGRVNEAAVVAIGPGGRDKVGGQCESDRLCKESHVSSWSLSSQDGKIVPMTVKVGEKVLVPEYGGTKLTFEEEVC